ncbi:MAG TPA: ATP-binding protein [Verrucomicrobiae bacterium]|jgi:hypothetical protein|nr:ATP-binding protein [Verrucomicrobiae bacterium]
METLSKIDGRTHNGGNQVLQLETSHLETTAQLYPEPMREPFVWLGSYVSRECDRNLEVLEARVKSLGFETTASTFAKILRGRWQKDASGNPLDAPVMKLRNFLQLVDRLRADCNISAMAGRVPFVKTGTWELIKNYIDVRRAADRICKFGLVIGPTGAQKTACYHQYCLENNHGSCVWLEAPETSHFTQFITDLASCYGVSAYMPTTRKKLRIRECVNAKRTIIVDNIQRLYRSRDGANQPVFGYLQKLQDETRCTIIMSASPDFKGAIMAGEDRGYFEQFVGRCGGSAEFLELPAYTPREDALQIADAFGLQHAEKHAKYLEDLARRSGRVRTFFQAFQTAKQIAEDNKLTIDHLREALGEE